MTRTRQQHRKCGGLVTPADHNELYCEGCGVNVHEANVVTVADNGARDPEDLPDDDMLDHGDPEGTGRELDVIPDADPAAPESVPEDPEAAATVGVFVRLDHVAREAVHWLWPARLPLGRLTGIIGDPGGGKSWLTLAITAALTRGAPLPGTRPEDAPPPGRVLILTAEDGIADTVVARLEDMGADMSMVKVLTAVLDHENERVPSLLTDAPIIEAELASAGSPGGYVLVIVDPINAYLGVALDTHRDAAIRAALAPLAAMAERAAVAVIFVLHLNKSKADRAIYRAQGGIAYVAAARMVHLVGLNPEDENERIFAWLKGNLAPPCAALAFSLAEGQFAWQGESPLRANALLAADDEDVASGALAEAEDYLRQALAGGPRGAKTLLAEAVDVGIARRTLMRAKAAMKIRSQMIGEEGKRGAGKWWWTLPATARDPDADPDIKDARP